MVGGAIAWLYFVNGLEGSRMEYLKKRDEGAYWSWSFDRRGDWRCDCCKVQSGKDSVSASECIDALISMMP